MTRGVFTSETSQWTYDSLREQTKLFLSALDERARDRVIIQAFHGTMTTDYLVRESDLAVCLVGAAIAPSCREEWAGLSNLDPDKREDLFTNIGSILERAELEETYNPYTSLEDKVESAWDHAAKYFGVGRAQVFLRRFIQEWLQETAP